MPRNEDTRLSRREREIMDVVFALKQATAAQVRENMPAPPTDAAVRAALRGLVEKGLLQFEYDGPRYVYTPTTSREKARRSAMDRLLHTFFDNSPEEAMVTLLEMKSAELNGEQRSRLKHMIEAAEREGR